MYKSLQKSFGVDAPIVLSSVLGLLFVALMMVLFPNEAKAQAGDVYRDSGAQTMQNVTRGVVLQLREVKVQPRAQSGYAGAAAGASVGGLLANRLGSNSDATTRGVLSILGAALGGIGGQVAAEHIGAETAVEILVEVQESNRQPRLMAVVQPLPAPDVQVGQMVYVLNEGGKNRVIPSAARLQAAFGN